MGKDLITRYPVLLINRVRGSLPFLHNACLKMKKGKPRAALILIGTLPDSRASIKE
ncbi:hypothetical protein [Bacillus sp. SG-1]|uniref:hypothetical protein n=1 Tax=Bacillus sp. SG-1 TaxID=161544 RepID=UPI000310B2C4|nr:hypothetical protein [Bacillus sp. SG-1]